MAREQREPREQDLVVEEGTGEPVTTTLSSITKIYQSTKVTKSIEKLDHIAKPESTEKLDYIKKLDSIKHEAIVGMEHEAASGDGDHEAFQMVPHTHKPDCIVHLTSSWHWPDSAGSLGMVWSGFSRPRFIT